MPWKIRKSGTKWQVINSETGDVKGTHDTEESAKRQMAALYRNVPESRKDLEIMQIQTKSVEATIEDVESSSDPGEFIVVLATDDLDRDGDTLKGDEWELPLPNRIQFNTDHDHKVASTVGSAIPMLEGNRIVCRGSWATTQHAQDTRQLVKDGHVTSVSVAYREKRNQKSAKPVRELINGSFVVVPANPKAVVLSSKSADDTPTEREVLTRAIELIAEVKTLFARLTTKSDTGEDDGAQHIQAPEAPEESADQDTADQDESRLLAEAKAKALTFQTRHV